MMGGLGRGGYADRGAMSMRGGDKSGFGKRGRCPGDGF